MLQTLKNAWRTKDIRSKILFTLLILLLYRVGTVIPVPFVADSNLTTSGSILGFMNMLAGGSLEQMTLFALGVTPYINASIIIQLLAVVFPKLAELSKDEQGKKKMNTITRALTIVLALVTAIGYFFLLQRNNLLVSNVAKSDKLWLYAMVIIACYCAGAALIMWLGEQINQKGIGNGISLILFANIVGVIPKQVIYFYNFVAAAFSLADNGVVRGIFAIVLMLALVAIVIALTVFVIWVTGSERRIPVQYAKQVKGRKMYGGQSSFLPIKLNMVGVMPVIFASSIVSVVPTILMLCGVDGSKATFWDGVYNFLGSEGWFYPIILLVLIVAFTYFYTEISFNPREIANNLKKNGGTVAGIRQGRPTSEYIQKILGKVTLVGAIFLSIVAILPIIGGPHLMQPLIQVILGGEQAASDAAYLTSIFTFGGTSLLIVVGVVLETFRELEAQLTMRSQRKLF